MRVPDARRGAKYDFASGWERKGSEFIHDLRHSCATLLLAQGVNPRAVMETLGHSQASLTLNTYSHVLLVLQKDAATKMNAVLSK